MNKVFWPLVIIIVCTSAYWLTTGIGPQSIPVIRLSNFSKASEVSDYTIQQLGPRLRAFKYFAVGIEERGSNEDEIEVQGEFLRKFSEQFGNNFVLVSDRKLDLAEFSKFEKVSLQNFDAGKRIAKINELILANKNIVFLFSTFETIHFRKEALVKIFEEGLHINVLSFSVVKFPLPSSEPNTIASLCNKANQDDFDYMTLACLVLSKAKKADSNTRVVRNKLLGFVEQQAERDFLIYLHSASL